ncbi:hypothetical protein D3C80_2037740 [compost metagenome]
MRIFLRWRDKSVDHFALCEQQFADVDCKTQLFRHDLNIHLTAANFRCERVIAPVAALRGIRHRQQIAFVTAHQLLQAR